MAIPIIIMGRSGTGKSSSLRNFKQGEIGLINVIGKPLPFKNNLKAVCTTDYKQIETVIRDAKAKTIVIDDAGYLITDMFMTRHSGAGGGNGVYSLYNDIGDSFYSLLRHIVTIPESQDKIVYLMMHEDTDDLGRSKIKTIGKLLDEKVTVEGMVAVLLQSVYMDGKYLFHTNGEGIVKSPVGMFADEFIDNDLKAVDATIRDFYNLSPLVATAPKAGAKNAK